MFTVIEFCKGNTRVGINEGLLIDSSNTFDGPNIIGVLRSEVSRMLGFYFAQGFSFLFLSFKSDHLRLSENQSFPSNTGLQGLQAFGKDFQVIPLPYATHPC